MNDKLEPGDLAFIIKSVTGKSVGKIVECVQVIGVDPNFGIIWLVRSQNKNLETFVDGHVGHEVHMPQDWLKKIPKDPLFDPNEDLYELPDKVIDEIKA